MSVVDDVLQEIKSQSGRLEYITPYTISRALGYRLSGRISYALKALEGCGEIERTYKSGNECFITLINNPADNLTTKKGN